MMRAGLPEERPDCRAGSVGCGLFPYRLDSSAEVAPSDTAVSHSTCTARFCQAPSPVFYMRLGSEARFRNEEIVFSTGFIPVSGKKVLHCR